MDTTIVLVYCLCDDLLKSQNHRDDVQCRLSDAEVMTIGLVAALYFGGNQALSSLFLSEQGYIRCGLSRSRLCRRLQRVRIYYETLFGVLGEYFKTGNTERIYVVDSMPVAVCDNARIRRCHIYKEKAYRGYVASKRRYYYGLKLNLLVTGNGEPVEFFLTPASYNDVTCLAWYDFALPPGVTIYADKAYNSQLIEELFKDYGIDFSPMRKSNATNPDPGWKKYLQAVHRKCIETTNSLIERLMPRHIHAVTAAGFETKVALFVIATAISYLTV